LWDSLVAFVQSKRDETACGYGASDEFSHAQFACMVLEHTFFPATLPAPDAQGGNESARIDALLVAQFGPEILGQPNPAERRFCLRIIEMAHKTEDPARFSADALGLWREAVDEKLASRQTREDGIRECLAIVQHYRYEDHEIRRLDWIEDSIKALLPPPKEGGKA